MDELATLVGQALVIVGIEPDRVSGSESGTRETHLIHILGERLAIAVRRGLDLNLGLRQMHLNAGAMLLGEFDTSPDQRLAAVHRDGRRHSRRHPIARQPPLPHDGFDRGEGLLDRRHPEGPDFGGEISW
jgi:hypothetical protein